jgi:hypothetical protein
VIEDTAPERRTHTLPWRRVASYQPESGRVEVGSPYIYDTEGRTVACAMIGSFEPAEIEAHASLIVTAVNCHAELLAALKQIDALPSHLAGDAWAIARAAITTAEGHGIR